MKKIILIFMLLLFLASCVFAPFSGGGRGGHGGGYRGGYGGHGR